MSALISFESSPTHIRGRVITVVFADRGSLQRPSCIVVHAYKPSLAFNGRMLPEDIDRMRRIAIRLDCVPAAVALYFRFAIPGTQRFRLDIQRNVQKAARDNDEFSRSRGVHSRSGSCLETPERVEGDEGGHQAVFRGVEELKGLDRDELLMVHARLCLLRTRPELIHHHAGDRVRFRRLTTRSRC